jgi:hypothetical protein
MFYFMGLAASGGVLSVETVTLTVVSCTLALPRH